MEVEIVRYCNGLWRPVLDPVCLWVCAVWFLAAFWASITALALALDRSRGRRLLRVLGVGFVLHAVVSELCLKHALGLVAPLRQRPYLAHPDLIAPVGYPFRDSSFPSSHNATSTLVATVFALLFPRVWPLSAAFALLMAFARMHNGMHYPSDVLTGMLLGLCYALLAWRIVGPPPPNSPRTPGASSLV